MWFDSSAVTARHLGAAFLREGFATGMKLPPSGKGPALRDKRNACYSLKSPLTVLRFTLL